MLPKEGLFDRLIWVEVPINTPWPPLIERLELLTVKEPKVVVPVPPYWTAKALDKVRLVALAVPATSSLKFGPVVPMPTLPLLSITNLGVVLIAPPFVVPEKIPKTP